MLDHEDLAVEVVPDEVDPNPAAVELAGPAVIGEALDLIVAMLAELIEGRPLDLQTISSTTWTGSATSQVACVEMPDSRARIQANQHHGGRRVTAKHAGAVLGAVLNHRPHSVLIDIALLTGLDETRPEYSSTLRTSGSRSL